VGIREDNTKLYLATTIALIAATLTYIVGQVNPSILSVVSDIIYQIVYIALIISAMALNNKYNWCFRERFSRIWLLASLSIFSAYIADLTWDIYVYWLNIPIPYPSIADIFYLLSLILAIQAVLCYILVFRFSLTKEALLLSLTAILLSAILASYFMINPILLQPISDAEKYLGIIYLILDFTLFSLSIIGLAIFFAGRIGKAWFFLALGIFLIMVADFLFIYTISIKEFMEATLSDLPAILGLILLVLSFNLYRKQI
jgi:hypothetical protein